MDRRRNSRVSARLPVRIWGVDAHDLPFMQLASVKNLSSTGAVVQGMRRQIKARRDPGSAVGRGKSPVSGDLDGHAGHAGAGEIGLQRLASEPCLWGVALGCYSELVAEG